jgi:hypothetical protein
MLPQFVEIAQAAQWQHRQVEQCYSLIIYRFA